MIQKLSSALFGLLVMGSMVGCGDSDKKQENTPSHPIAVKAELNPAFLKWEKEPRNKIKKSDRVQEHARGYIPPLSKPTVHQPLNRQEKLLNGLVTDSKFDLRDENLDGNFNDSRLTPVKDQGQCGACWAFATIGALESDLKIIENNTFDFSENHLKHNHGLAVAPCDGGNMAIATAYFAKAKGPVNESDDPYFENSTTSNTDAPRMRYIDNIIQLPVRANTSDNTYLKEALVNYGALYVDIHIYGMGNATADNNYSVYNSSSVQSDHAVLLVGWDDNYQAQGQTGAFIVKNSWGTDWGEEGYFYVPYTDQSFAFGEVAYFDDKSDTEATSFDIVHDTAPNGSVSATSYGSTTYGISIYPLDTNQTIKSVGIDNGFGDDTNITISIFKNVSINNDVSFSEPTVSETFSHLKKGWNTLQLQTPIELNTTRDKFAVQVIMNENNSEMSWLPVDGNQNFSDGTSYSILNPESNQSFYSANGSNWTDLAIENNSLAIKVFAQSENNESSNTTDINSDFNGTLQGVINAIEVNGSTVTLPPNTKIQFRPNQDDYEHAFTVDIDSATGRFYEDNVSNDYNGSFAIYIFASNDTDEPDNPYAPNNIILFQDDTMNSARLNEITLTMPQVVEMFGLRFIGNNDSGRLAVDGNKLKINNPENTSSNFSVEINSSALKMDANITLFAQSSTEDQPNAISLNFGFTNNENYLNAELMIMPSQIVVWSDINESAREERLIDFQDISSDFNVSLPHVYSIELTETNHIKFSVDEVEKFITETTYNNISYIDNKLFLSGEATAYIHDVSYDNVLENTNEGNGDSGYQQELNEIRNELENNSSISQEFRDRKQTLIDEIQALLEADSMNDQAIQAKFDELRNLEDAPPVDDTHVDVNLSQSQIVELFGLEFNATNAVAKIEDDNGKLKITGYNRANNDANVENIDINFSAKEFNTTLAFTPEADLDIYWPNSIQFQVSIWEDNEYHESNMQIYTDGISISTDDQRYDDFNMTDFNLSELHNYGIKITDDNRTLFMIDGIQVFEANLSITTPINQIRTGIRFIGKGVASIESFDYSNWFVAPLDSNDLDFIDRINTDIDDVLVRVHSFTVPSDLNNSINLLVEDIQTLLENNPLDYSLIDSKMQELSDYADIADYMNELERIRNDIDATANLSQDLNNTLQSLMNDIESQLTVPLDRNTINSIFDSLNNIDFSFITQREQEILEIKEAITTSANFNNETNSSMNTIIDNIDELLGQYPVPYDDVNDKLEELRNLERSLNENNDDSDHNMYGDNATIIQGVIILPSDMNLTPEADCFNESDNGKPKASCNAVFIDLFDGANEFLGSTIVQPDGNYTLYFEELEHGEPREVTVKIHTKINGVEEYFYRDFGTDNLIDGTDEASDSFKSERDLEWHEDSAGTWIPNINFLIVSTKETTLNLDLTTKDADKFIVSGTVQVPANFIPGEIKDENGDEKGWNMVALTAINTTTGKQYWTEIGQTETSSGNHIYPFNFKLPNSPADYIIRLEKMTDKNWIEMYLDDESDVATASSDHDFDGDEALVSAIGVEWKEKGNGIWTPDTNNTGYFTVSDNVNNIAINITNYGANFKKIEGIVTPPTSFNLSDSTNHIYVEVIDAKTGSWLGNVAVNSDGSYSILLGNEINPNGYIVKANLEHWNQNNWQDSYWKSFYLDFTDLTYNFKDESEVRWEESIDEATNISYWVPNVQPLIIQDTTILDIDFTSYTAPETYEVSGTITGLPSSAKWVNIYIYNPTTFIGKSAELEGNSFTVKGLKEGKYIMDIGYSDENNGYKYVDYLIVNTANSDFRAIDSMEVKWVPFGSNDTVIPQSTIEQSSFDWNSILYWAPEETASQKTLIELSSDMNLGEISIPQPVPPSTLVVNLSGVDANKYVNCNLFVPNQPVGRWESNTSTANGVSITISDLKARDDYQLQVWVDGVEYWYNGTTLTSDYYEGNGFSIAQTTTLDLTVPNDKSTITATFALGNENANKTFDVYLWQTVSPYNNAWESFTADSNGDVNVTLAIKHGSNYIMEIYNTQTWNGFTVDIGANAQDSGDEHLILAQNSWTVDTEGIWNPKQTVLIDMNNDLNLGTLLPPELRTVTFTLANLATLDGNITEDVWISLENNTSWYGAGNGDWSDWRNPTFSNTLSMKVPNTTTDYYIYMFTMKHESGLIDINGTGHGEISSTTINFSDNSAKVTWDITDADTIAISDDTNISVTLKSTTDYRLISGLVTLGDGDIEAGWMCANSQTDSKGNCGEVDANGTYSIGGLSPTDNEVYTVEYWANSGAMFNLVATWEDVSSDLTVDMDIYSATKINILGTVTDSDADNPSEVVLLDVNGTNWKVLDTQELIIGSTFSFNDLPAEINGHHYEIAVASINMNATTGVTAYTVKSAIQKDGTATTTTDIAIDDSITITIN